MTDYLKRVDELELEITVAIEEYNQTGDINHLIKANHYTHQLAAERRVHDTG